MHKTLVVLFTKTFSNENNDEDTLLKIWIDRSLIPKASFAYQYHTDSQSIGCMTFLFPLEHFFRIDRMEYRDEYET